MPNPSTLAAAEDEIAYLRYDRRELMLEINRLLNIIKEKNELIQRLSGKR